MCKHAFLLVTVGVIASACAPGPRIESRSIVRVDGASPVEIRLSLSAERRSQQARWTSAAEAAVRQHLRMFGTAPADAIAIVDQRRGSAAAAPGNAIVVAAPLWSSSRGMAVEAAVTRAVSQVFWRRELPCGPDGDWFVDGIARYASTVSLASQYDGQRDPPAAGAYEQRVAGGFLPWVLPVVVPAWAGSASAYRAHARADPARPGSASERDALEAKTALAARTLAAWVGDPTWDAALQVFVARARGRCGSWHELQDAATDVSGLDLSWFFAQAFAGSRIFDYGVERIASTPDTAAPGRYRTALVVRRYGDATFSGAAAPPIPPFESGRGVEVAVHFADGRERTAYWDGRAASRSFEFVSDSPGVSAMVDPRQIIALDTDRTDNSRSIAPRTALAATRWSAAWASWLEHLLLTYASLA